MSFLPLAWHKRSQTYCRHRLQVLLFAHLSSPCFRFVLVLSSRYRKALSRFIIPHYRSHFVILFSRSYCHMSSLPPKADSPFNVNDPLFK
jgi:hypothetical protein